MNRVAYIAYYFPPLVGIASERAASLTAELPSFGWEPVVITAQNGFYHQRPGYESPGCEVIRTRSVELSRNLRGAYTAAARRPPQDVASAGLSPVRTGRWGAFLRRLVRDLVYVPDAQVGWIPFATSSLGRIMRQPLRPSVIFSTSVPYSAHLVAMQVARRCGVPWVAEFRDPWTTSPGPEAPLLRLRKGIDRALEGSIVTRADHIVVTSKATRDELAGAHTLPQRKISVITNGFIPIAAGRPPGPTQPMTILYAGTVNVGEDLCSILKTLGRTHERFPGSFVLRVQGPPNRWQLALNSGLHPGWLHLDGVVTPSEARLTMASSSCLLLIQTNPAYDTVLPGKAFEYVGARRPILAAIAGEGELAQLLESYADVRLVDRTDLSQLETTVEELLREHRAGTLQAPRVSIEDIHPLRRSEQAKELAAVFSQLGRQTSNRAM